MWSCPPPSLITSPTHPLAAASASFPLVLDVAKLAPASRPLHFCFFYWNSVLCSSHSQIRRTIQVPARSSPLLWPFPATFSKAAPDGRTPSVSIIIFAIFPSYLFPAVITLWCALYLSLTCPIVFLLSHTCSMRTETLFGLYTVSSAPTVQPCP